jgi:hypothetical protein
MGTLALLCVRVVFSVFKIFTYRVIGLFLVVIAFSNMLAKLSVSAIKRYAVLSKVS